MPWYRVIRTECWNITDTYTIEIDANDEDHATDIACHYFSTTLLKPETIEELQDSGIEIEEITDAKVPSNSDERLGYHRPA